MWNIWIKGDGVGVLQEWLGQLGEEMKVTLQYLLVQCLADGHSDSGMDPLKSPSQVCKSYRPLVKIQFAGAMMFL